MAAAKTEPKKTKESAGFSELGDFPSVNAWVRELRWMTELECMSILQGKPLDGSAEQDNTAFQVQAFRDAIDRVKFESNKITEGFNSLFKCFDNNKWSTLNTETMGVTCSIRKLIQLCNSHVAEVPSFIQEQQEVVMGESAKLLQHTASAADKNVVHKVPLVNQLTFLGQSFSRLVDSTLGYLVKQIVSMMEACTSVSSLHVVINNIITLGLEGEHMCYMLAREGAVRSLADVCRRENVAFTRSKALRGLATICCAPECVTELEKEHGIDLLLDILMDMAVPESVQGEAAGVIAQITSPVLDQNHQLCHLADCLQVVLTALLDLCERTDGHETFLLSAAAMANITFIDSSACTMLQELKAPQLLVKACMCRKAKSLFAKDQVATILANMAAIPTCQESVRCCGGLDLLVTFLHQKPSLVSSTAERSACERVQQKAAIALMRLCQDTRQTYKVIRQKGIPRFVELCREAEARNNSDAVLVACLAALRKVCALYGREGISSLDYQQLVLPQLMDSFLMCSHTDENFV
ncbi:protein inscuteable homolog isoform X1 [Aplysia californica]|uniref:Protein inscuteable homolog isoform X1 n=1 Tax=Aplysia californica TaxID=6500 RepID=A0ABM0JYL4_APLCA|nr:protein inscuteable homolog isoform X1 [Aplysia californica]